MDSFDEKQPTTSIWKLVKWPVIITSIFFVLQVIVQPLFMLTVPAGYGAALAVGGSTGHSAMNIPRGCSFGVANALYIRKNSRARARFSER